MAGQTSFTEAEASAVVNEFLDAVNGIKTTISRVQETFDAARAGWEGDAAIAGQAASTKWQEEAADLNMKIDDVNQTISESNTTLANVDPTNVDTLTNLI